MTHPLFEIPNLPGRALCAEIGGDEWFPDKGGSAKAAKAVCARCEVRAACLTWALAQPDRLYGIWAGTSEKERRQLRNPTRHAA